MIQRVSQNKKLIIVNIHHMHKTELQSSLLNGYDPLLRSSHNEHETNCKVSFGSCQIPNVTMSKVFHHYESCLFSFHFFRFFSDFVVSVLFFFFCSLFMSMWLLNYKHNNSNEDCYTFYNNNNLNCHNSIKIT